MAKFTVDTHLFRELGELLVGRDSTALVELVKNAYDADATEVIVYGEALGDSERGWIRITDNGVGMTRPDFENGVLRIASRLKEGRDRRSPRLHSRYTGAKGIGRLAAHKLARTVELSSVPWQDGAASARSGLEAVIDWDRIERCQTLDDPDALEAVEVRDVSAIASHGTTITLRRLRRRWTKQAHARFLEEVQTFEAPRSLVTQLPSTVVKQQLLFAQPIVRDLPDSAGAEFRVTLDGELRPPDDYWHAALRAADWVIEIDADEVSKNVRYAIAPTERTKQELPASALKSYSVQHPSPEHGPFFQARILIRTGQLRGSDPEKEWAGRANGVRVFWEGFRVLPYGEPRNDWLGLDRDVTERRRGILPGGPFAALFADEEPPEESGLIHLPNKHYFGGVFLTEKRSPNLRVLVNREGFVPDSVYETMVSLVRGGIDLATRVRAAATFARRMQRRAKRAGQRKNEPFSPSQSLRSALSEATKLTGEAAELIKTGKVEQAKERVEAAVRSIRDVGDVSEILVEEGAMLRVLASVGTQLASFVHEMNGLLHMTEGLESTFGHVRRTAKLRPSQRKVLGDLARGLADLRRNLERQASYLIDIVTPDARRRRVRQGIAERFDAAARLVAFAAEKRGITIQNGIPKSLRSPAMFPAELTAVFSNLLTNAVKAAGPKGRIRAVGAKTNGGGATVRVENTGVAVQPSEGERWFQPFESSTVAVYPVLGQGMGLGLPITRTILEEYGASIRFASPSSGYATALEIELPG